MKKTPPPAAVPPRPHMPPAEIARLQAEVARHTDALEALEAANDGDEPPEVHAHRAAKERCLRHLIRLDPSSVDAHAALVEFFLEVDEVHPADLAPLERLNAAKPRRAIADLVRRARASLAESHDFGGDDLDD